MPSVHIAARSQQNPSYPKRFPVPDDKVPWSVPFPDYEPTPHSDEILLTASYADAGDPKSIPDLAGRLTYEPGGLDIDGATGAPLNPAGRTGIVGRGHLGKWGPNHSGDPIVTRYHPSTGEVQLVVIKRRDTGAWALPGGMVDPGEAVSATVRREFKEEAGALQDRAKREQFTALTDALFSSGGEEVFRGYVDDPRNTDNAWLETCALHFHCNAQLGAMLPLEAGDDASHVKWVTVDESLTLYANHRSWVDIVVARMYRRRMLKRARTLMMPVLIASGAVLMASCLAGGRL